MGKFEAIDARLERDELKNWNRVLFALWIITITTLPIPMFYTTWKAGDVEAKHLSEVAELERQIKTLTIERNVLIEAKGCK